MLKNIAALAGALALFLSLAGFASAGKPADPGADRADPGAKTLPSKASDTAKANAFGQQGAKASADGRSHRAAQAAQAEANAEADRAARPDSAARASGTKAAGQGSGASDRGRAIAATASGSPAAVPASIDSVRNSAAGSNGSTGLGKVPTDPGAGHGRRP